VQNRKLKKEKVIIMGAGGRDFHNFNMAFRGNPRSEVVAFTAAQIPFIERRIYPPELSGQGYPDGIPIHPEEELQKLILIHKIDKVVFAYSDVSYEHVMQKASLCLSLGSDFVLLGPEKTMLKSNIPVISVCAVRTGCGKSIITRKIASLLKEKGIKVSIIRHPMAYCDFAPIKKFSSMRDIDALACTIEEREEFEQHIAAGAPVYSGIDYKKVMKEAEKDSQVILWDGGNNDFPFIIPDLEIVLADALRPGHEMLFYPGHVNLKRADLMIITKTNYAKKDNVKRIRENIAKENPGAKVYEAPSMLSLSDKGLIRGKRALVIEDGPTITHGGLAFGAGMSATKGLASKIINPRKYAVGSIKKTFDKYPHIGPVLPAMGYSEKQIKELEETIAKVPCDVVVIATPVDLMRFIKINKPAVRVFYDFEIGLSKPLEEFLKKNGI